MTVQRIDKSTVSWKAKAAEIHARERWQYYLHSPMHSAGSMLWTRSSYGVRGNAWTSTHARAS